MDVQTYPTDLDNIDIHHIKATPDRTHIPTGAIELVLPTVDPVMLITYDQYSVFPIKQHTFVFMVLHSGSDKTHKRRGKAMSD